MLPYGFEIHEQKYLLALFHDFDAFTLCYMGFKKMSRKICSLYFMNFVYVDVTIWLLICEQKNLLALLQEFRVCTCCYLAI